MRRVIIGVVLALAACSGCASKRGARVGTPERGTRYECKGEKRVVDDPAKCNQPQ